MKKVIYIVTWVLFSTTMLSCDKEAVNEEFQLHNSESIFATGGEDNDEEPDDDENKLKT